MAEKRRKDEVQAILRRYQSRGEITRRAFCEAEGIGLSTLGYYLRQKKTPGVQLVRVKVAEEAGSGGGRFTLVLANGRRIECGVAELGHLIRMAEHA